MESQQRPIRILNIGNVANYAYNIGKILQENNIVSHSINWDYYHINAQPLWEEGVFDPSTVGDYYFPKLPTSEEVGFQQPDWYVQGPRVLACLTLIARNEGKARLADFFQRALDRHLDQLHDPDYRQMMAAGHQHRMEWIYTDMLGDYEAKSRTSPVRSMALRLLNVSSRGARFVETGYGIRGRMGAAKWALLKKVAVFKWVILNKISALRWILLRKSSAYKWFILNNIDALRSAAMRQGAKLPAPVKVRLKAILGMKRASADASDRVETSHIQALAAEMSVPDTRERGEQTAAKSTAKAVVEQISADAPLNAGIEPGSPAAPISAFEAHVQDLIEQYRAIYPERAFDPMLLRQYEHTLPLMRRLFSHYDLVIGYGIEGIWPLMAGVPYVAYEFGTIRNLPFQDSPMGKLAALTYLNSERTIVTNSDNEAPAKRLGRPYFFLPHVVNERGLLDAGQAAAARAEFIHEHGGDFLVFHPARQHWDEQRDTNWDKGNDHLFRGFARLVKERAPNARCIAVAWGEKLDRSKELIAELGISDNVVWITPQPHIAMMRYIGICDVLCDQFTIPTFGGIPPKAFHAAKPVVTCFDPELHQWCFDEMPPLIPANSAELVYDALAKLYSDRSFAAELGRKGADWYRRENSNSRVREVLMQKLKGFKEAGRDI